jgi:hypothetical protein
MTTAASYLQRYGLIVNPENVLGIRAVILQEAHDLGDMLEAGRDRVMLPPLADDPVSKDMSLAFNEVTKQILAQAKEHVASLFDLCDELAATAREYGRAETDITASFGPSTPPTAASALPPAVLKLAGLGAPAARPQPQSIAEALAGGRP